MVGQLSGGMKSFNNLRRIIGLATVYAQGLDKESNRNDYLRIRKVLKQKIGEKETL